MSLLSPGKFLSSLVVLPQYDIRDHEGARFASASAGHCHLLLSADAVVGRITSDGRLKDFCAVKSLRVIKALLNCKEDEMRVTAEANNTVIRLGQTWVPCMRRVLGWDPNVRY